MRDLTTTELETVSGAAPAPAPRITLVGVKLSRKDQAALAAVLSLIRRRGPAA